MRSPSYSSQFHRDVKRLQRRGKDLDKLKKLIGLLLAAQPLPPLYKDHPLKLNWAGYRDAHIEPDWVLIYSATAEKVHLERTGSHEELFENDWCQMGIGSDGAVKENPNFNWSRN